MYSGNFFVLPLLIGLVYLGVIVYVFILGTRLVSAVESIARSMDARTRPEA